MRQSQISPVGAVALFVVGLAGGGLLLWATPHGIGLYYDSMPYMESAQNLLAGMGMGRNACDGFKFLTRYPPLYSLILALGRAIGFNMLSVARLVSAASLSLAAFLVGLTIWRSSGRKTAAIVGAMWVAIASPVLNSFSWAMTEPLYLVLWLGSLILADMYISSNRRSYLIGSSLLAGLGAATRYVGVLPILACTLVLAALAFRRQVPWKDLGPYLLVASAPLSVWTLRSAILTNMPFNRSLGIHPPSREALRQAADTVIGWFVPPELLHSEEAVLASALGLATVILLIFVATQRMGPRSPDRSQLVILHVVSSLVYIAGLLISRSLFDPTTPLDDRLLVPTYISLGILLLTSLTLAIGSRAALVSAVAIAAFAVFGSRQVSQLPRGLAHLRSNGQGYAASRWANSEVGARLRELQPRMIYTNDITAVYFIAGLPSCAIPTAGSDEALATMRSRMEEPGSVLAIFGNLSGEFMPHDSIVAGLAMMERFSDGALYAGGGPAGP